jgi:hypothetical protein
VYLERCVSTEGKIEAISIEAEMIYDILWYISARKAPNKGRKETANE